MLSSVSTRASFDPSACGTPQGALVPVGSPSASALRLGTAGKSAAAHLQSASTSRMSPDATHHVGNALSLVDKIILGLTDPINKSLPQEACYNAFGSAVFNARMLLPEYGLSRAETRILTKHAAQIPHYLPASRHRAQDISSSAPVGGALSGETLCASQAMQRVPPYLQVADLGCGSGIKTRIILESLLRYGSIGFHPIDISPSAISECSSRMGDLLQVHIEPYTGDFLDGVRAASDARVHDEPLLVLFLGSTIGQFHDSAADQFFKDVYALLSPGDSLLIAADLMKSPSILIAAYGECMGLTHVEMTNMFTHVNETVSADLDIRNFEAITQVDESRRTVERFMRAKCAQVVSLGITGDQVSIGQDEMIKVYSGRKFLPDEIGHIAQRAGFSTAVQWLDEEWPFAVTLLNRSRDV